MLHLGHQQVAERQTTGCALEIKRIQWEDSIHTDLLNSGELYIRASSAKPKCLGPMLAP
jgi:hypothetical protein